MSYPLAPLRRRRSACHVMNPHRRVSPASGTLNRSHMRVKMTTYTLARVSMRHVSPARITLERDRDGRMPGGPVSACLIDAGLSFAEDKPPNGSRLSCGARAGGRKRPALRYELVGAQTHASSESRPRQLQALVRRPRVT